LEAIRKIQNVLGIDERLHFKYSLSMPKKTKNPKDKSVYFGGLDHTGGKKLQQPGSEKGMKARSSRKHMVGTPRKTG
jgi:hypothetical protein